MEGHADVGAGKERQNLLYHIYYGDMLMYVGRTHQPLPRRIHGHLFGASLLTFSTLSIGYVRPLYHCTERGRIRPSSSTLTVTAT